MVDPIIRAKDLTKSFKVLRRRPGFWGGIRTLFSSDYEIVKAVDEVSFAIGPGELVGYIGPNGAGKSTTIKMLTGILYPSGGEVTVDGFIPQRERVRNSKQIGVIFGQRSQLIWDIPARDSFDLMRKMYAIPLERYRENLATFVELLELRELMERPVRLLSLGQRMRCELVVAMLHDPKILYLDEPTIGMDVVAKERIREFIRHLNSERGTTVLLTTHDVTDIEQLCRRVMIIDKGHIIYDGNLSALKRQYGRLRRLRFSLPPTEAVDGLDLSLAELSPSAKLAVGDDEGHYVISFDPQAVAASEVTRFVVNRYAVTDLSVEEADLEGIIRQIYANGAAVVA